MDFYLDENLPERVAESLNALDDENSIQFITKVAPKGTKDVQLIDLLNAANANVIITNDDVSVSKVQRKQYERVHNLVCKGCRLLG